ncbi:MAG: UbiA prenyltransferase family protein [Candidatus Aenigmatarchaeota archaeon]
MAKISHFLRLTRWNDWILNIAFVLFGYFLPLTSISVYVSLLFMVIVFLLVQSFGFAINDYFDAPFDKLKKSTRNLISNGLIKKYEALIFCVALVISGLLISLFYLPFTSFLVILILYIMFFVYSAPPFRFKEKLLLDVVVHGLATPLLLLASYALVSIIDFKIMLIATAVFASSVVVCITQEVRDIAADKHAGFRTTADFLGYRKSLNLVRVLIISGVVLFSLAIILFLPKYLLLLMLSSFFPLKYLFGKPTQKEFYHKSIDSWNKGIITLFIIGVLLLPIHMGWIAL